MLPRKEGLLTGWARELAECNKAKSEHAELLHNQGAAARKRIASGAPNAWESLVSAVESSVADYNSVYEANPRRKIKFERISTGVLRLVGPIWARDPNTGFEPFLSTFELEIRFNPVGAIVAWQSYPKSISGES